MSELKIVVPVELEPKNKDEFQKEVEAIKPKVKVQLEADDKIGGIDDAVEKAGKSRKYKPTVDTRHLDKQFDAAIQRLEKRTDLLNSDKFSGLKGTQDLLKGINLTNLKNAINRIRQFQQELSSSGKLSKGWKQALKDVEAVISATDKFMKVSGDGLSAFDSHSSVRQYEKMKVAADSAAEASKKFQESATSGNAALTDKAQAFVKAVQDYKKAIDDVSNKRDVGGEVTATELDGVTRARERALLAQKEFNQELAKTERLNNQNTSSYSKSSASYVKNLATVEAKLERMQWLQENFGRAFKDPAWASSFNSIKSAFESLRVGDNIDTSKLQGLTKELSLLEAQARASGNAGKTFGQRWNDAIAKFTNWMSMSSLVMEGTQKLREMYDNTVAINTAMTDLRKVTTETEASYDNYLTKAARRSADMGTKITDYIAGSTEWARLGERLSEATNLGEVSAMYYNVGDGIDSVSDATLKLNSALKAFDLESSKAMNVMDMLNHVGRFCPNAQ